MTETHSALKITK